MATVAEDILPVYSPSKHQAVPTSSLRRRRFIVTLFALASLSTVFFWGPQLFRRQYANTAPVIFADPSPLLEQDPIPTVALTSLGLEAEQVYHLGSLSLSDYSFSLENFITTAFPSRLVPLLTDSLHRFLDFESTKPLPERPKIVWQTNEFQPSDKLTRSWKDRNHDHEYRFLNDQDADDWVHRHFKGSAIEWTWNFLPHIIMKADFLRYLLLLVEGGVYSDIDTTCLKSIPNWGSDPEIRGRAVEGPPGAIIGIEADVGERADWHQWWSRPIQIVQWTIAASPGHPILLDTVRRIYIKALQAERRMRQDPSLDKENILKKDLTILEWTGPAVFTDAALRFLRIQSDIKWPELRGLKTPVRAGSVTILPVTGFSPGVGNFGAQEKTDRQAMVHHEFNGSWKEKGRPKSR